MVSAVMFWMKLLIANFKCVIGRLLVRQYMLLVCVMIVIHVVGVCDDSHTYVISECVC